MGQIQNALTGAIGAATIAKVGYDNRINTDITTAAKGIARLRQGGDELFDDEMKFDEYQNFGDEEGVWDEAKSEEWSQSIAKRRKELTHLRKEVLPIYEKLPKRAQRLAQIQAQASYGSFYKGGEFDIEEVKK